MENNKQVIDKIVSGNLSEAKKMIEDNSNKMPLVFRQDENGKFWDDKEPGTQAQTSIEMTQAQITELEKTNNIIILTYGNDTECKKEF